MENNSENADATYSTVSLTNPVPILTFDPLKTTCQLKLKNTHKPTYLQAQKA